MDAGSLIGAFTGLVRREWQIVIRGRAGFRCGRREWQFVIRAVWGVVCRGLGVATPSRLGRLAVAGGVCLLQGSDGWAERPMPAAGGHRS